MFDFSLVGEQAIRRVVDDESLTAGQRVASAVVVLALKEEGITWLATKCGRYWIRMLGFDYNTFWNVAVSKTRWEGMPYTLKDCPPCSAHEFTPPQEWVIPKMFQRQCHKSGHCRYPNCIGWSYTGTVVDNEEYVV